MSKSVQLLNGLLFRPRSEYRTAVVNTASNNNSPQVLVKNSELVKKLRDLKLSDITYFTVKYHFFPFMQGSDFGPIIMKYFIVLVVLSYVWGNIV